MYRSRRKRVGKGSGDGVVSVGEGVDMNAALQENGARDESHAAEERVSDVSAVAPEVERHTEDRPGGDLNAKESADSPIVEDSAEPIAVGPESKKEATYTTAHFPQEDEHEAELPSPSTTPTKNPGEHTASTSIPEPELEQPLPNPTETPLEIETQPTELAPDPDLESKIANMEPIMEVDSQGGERPIPRAMPSMMRVPIETPTPLEQDSELEDRAGEFEVAEREPDRHIDWQGDVNNGARTTPTITHFPDENVPVFELLHPTGMKEGVVKDESPLQLEEEHPLDRENASFDTSGEKEMESPSSTMEEDTAERFDEQPKVKSSNEENTRKFDNSLEPLELVQATEVNNLGEDDLEEQAVAINSQPTPDHCSIREPASNAFSAENSAVKDFSPEDVESQESQPERLSSDFELGQESNIHSSSEKPVADFEGISEARDDLQNDIHEEAPAAETEAANEHEAAVRDELPVADVTSVADTYTVPEKDSPTQEASSSPEYIEAQGVDRSPQFPAVKMDTNIAEDLSAAANDLPSLQDETRDAMEEAVPTHPDESISLERDGPDANPESEDELEHNEVSHSTESDAADHEASDRLLSAATDFDGSHEDEENEVEELSDSHATITGLSETPPTSLEGSIPSINDATPKEDHESADENDDTQQDPFEEHARDLEVANMEHEGAENSDQTVEHTERPSSSVQVHEREVKVSDESDDEMSSRSMEPERASEQLPMGLDETRIETSPEKEMDVAPGDENPTEMKSDAPPVSDARDEPQTQDSKSTEEEPTQSERPQTPQKRPKVIDFPSTPSAQMVHQTEDHSLAESPVTVVNADDLFADDDEGEEYEEYQQHEPQDANSDLGYDGSGYGPDEVTSHAEPFQVEDSGSFPLGDAEKAEILNHDSNSEHPTTHTGLFASLVDTIRSDLPAVEKMVHDSNEGHHEDDHSEEDSSDHEAGFHSEYATPLDHISEEEGFHTSHDMDSSLHIRTRAHTTDTVPSFEAYAHSDDESSPPTPIDEIAERAEDALQTERLIRSSWPVQSHDHEVDLEEDSQDLKPQASPMQTDFDSFSTPNYPSYVTPKTSQANLKGEHIPETPESDVQSSPDESDSGHQDLASSPSRASLNTNLQHNPNDFPPSETHPQTDAGANSQPSTPNSRPSIPNNSSIFQKTRSLFESSSSSPPPPTQPPTRPLSNLFTLRSNSSPSPPPKPASLKGSTSRPNSLYQIDNPASELIVPRSLDAVPGPPSPGFIIPAPISSNMERKGSSGSEGNRRSIGDKEVRQRSSTSFLNGISRLVAGTAGTSGLEDSIHNPARAPLLQNQEERGEK